MDELCPYGVYVLKCKTYPECVCGRHIARAVENSKQLEDTHICDCCYGTGIGIGGQPCMACKGAADAKAAFDKHAKELDSSRR